MRDGGGHEPPAWEKAKAAAAGGVGKGLSSYIKPKKQVAALFGAKKPAIEVSPLADLLA